MHHTTRQQLDQLQNLIDTNQIDWLADPHDLFAQHDLPPIDSPAWHTIAWFGPLDAWRQLHGVAVSDILINGIQRPVTLVAGGRYLAGQPAPHPGWIAFAQHQLAAHAGLAAPQAASIWGEQCLLQGTAHHLRFVITRPPLTPQGPTIAVRILPQHWPNLEALVQQQRFSADLHDLLLHALQRDVTLLIAGTTGSGKTTLAAALMQAYGRHHRVVVIEDARELPYLPDSLHMEVLQSGLSFGACVRTALRQRPDRIVVGEVRGGEALAMLQAAATGHPGIGTIHAPDPATALANLERMACEAGEVPPDVVRRMLASKAIPLLVIQMQQCRISRIEELLPQGQAISGSGFVLNTIYEQLPDGRQIRRPVSGEWGDRRY
jgi:Flp pilus assembly CpaF family ATPase